MTQAEQTQAREQAELVELRLEESRRATSERAAAKAKVELDDVRERRAAALADLRTARTVAESLEKARALRGQGGRGGGAGEGVAGEGADRGRVPPAPSGLAWSSSSNSEAAAPVLARAPSCHGRAAHAS